MVACVSLYRSQMFFFCGFSFRLLNNHFKFNFDAIAVQLGNIYLVYSLWRIRDYLNQFISFLQCVFYTIMNSYIDTWIKNTVHLKININIGISTCWSWNGMRHSIRRHSNTICTINAFSVFTFNGYLRFYVYIHDFTLDAKIVYSTRRLNE